MRYDALLQQIAPPAAMNRRDFLKVTVAAGGGMLFSMMPMSGARAAGEAKKLVDPLPFIKINPDNTVEIFSNRLEFGQGTQTSLPMLIAEEMDVPIARVRGLLAPAAEPFKDPMYHIQMTGGSSAIAHSWMQYRQIGATARAMLRQAAADLWGVPLAEVRTEAGYCLAGARKASYGELAAAAAKLPLPEKVDLKESSQFKLIGKATRRLDGEAVAHGRKKFGYDIALKNQLTAMVVHAPTFGGKVASFDAARALAIKGVRGVFEVPTDRGGSGVAIVASGFWPAKQARDALSVQWQAGPSASVSSDELLASYRKLAAEPKALAADWQNGGSAAALAGAAKKIVAEFEFPYLAHAPMEPLNCVIDLAADQCTVWVGSQFQTVDQGAMASVVGLKPDQVALITLPAGGGFGRRAVPGSDYLREAAAVAKAWRGQGNSGPLKIVWTREDDIRGGYYRPAHVHRVEIGLDDKGEIVAWDHAIVGQSILKGTPFEAFLVKNGVDKTMTEGVVENHYGLPLRLRIEHPQVPVPVLWYRSVGHTHTAFVMETLIDQMAKAAGKDPVEYRLARLKNKPRHVAALKLAVEKSGYGKKKLAKGRAWGVAVHESFNSVVAYVAEASLSDGRPKVHKVTAGVHCNRVVNPLTAAAQIEGGLMFGLSMTLPGNAITLKNGVVEQSQYTDYSPARMADAPVTEVHFVESEEAPTGLGEPGTCVIAPAVANAVFALSGKALRKLPFETV